MTFKTIIWIGMLHNLPGRLKQNQDIALIKLFYPEKGGINVQYKQLSFKGIVSKEDSFQFTTVIVYLLSTRGHKKKKDYIPFEDFPKGFHQSYRVEGGPLFMPRASHPQAVPVLKDPKLGSDLNMESALVFTCA